MNCKVMRNCNNYGKKTCPLSDTNYSPTAPCSDVKIDKCSSYSPHIIHNEASLHSVCITGEPKDPTVKHVFIDGKEMKGITGVTIGYAVDRVPIVYIELLSMDIEVRDIDANIVQYTNSKDPVKKYVDGKNDCEKSCHE